jgi:assimilatory nitrate reductase catalytic subunit
MGFAEGFSYGTPAEIFAEHARLSALENGGTRGFDIGGLAGLQPQEYEELEPIQWPLPEGKSGGTERLFEDGRFFHADGRARFVPTPPREPACGTDDEFPLILNTGRIRDQWHTMTRTGQSSRLAEHLPEPFVDLHAQDALSHALRAGELARVTSARGSMVVRVRTSGEIARKSLFAPIHWSAENASQARAGALINPNVDPLSGEPEFKHTPVRVEPFPVEWYGFLLTREPRDVADVTWWTVIRGSACLRYELAGRQVPANWGAWMRERLGALDPGEDYLDYHDAAAGSFRAARLVDDRLAACLYISRRPDLPERNWLMGLFAQGELSSRERAALLAGRAPGVEPPAGPLVCSCFAVGRDTLRRVIAEQSLTDIRQVGARLKAGTNCGSCLPEIRALLAERAPTAARSAPAEPCADTV